MRSFFNTLVEGLASAVHIKILVSDQSEIKNLVFMGKKINADLSRLPKRKEEELRHITRIIHDTCKTEFIILFGSYARGDFVERDVTYAKGLVTLKSFVLILIF